MRRLPALATLALLVAGCMPSGPGTSTSPTTPGGSMSPSVVRSEEEGRALVTRVEQALEAHAPGLSFGEPERTRAACGTAGTRAYFLAIAQGAVPDDAWEAAAGEVEQVVRAHGLTERTVLTDVPGRHDVSFDGTAGGRVVIGTEKNTTVTVETACSEG